MFIVEGEGKRPTLMEQTTIDAPVGGSSMDILTFTNPLSHPSHFTISLLNNDSDHFCALLKQTKRILLHPGSAIDIPLLFAPDSMELSHTAVLVTEQTQADQIEPLCWQYPVVGKPRALVSLEDNQPLIHGPARERVEQRVVVRMGSLVSHGSARVRAVTPSSSLRDSIDGGEVNESSSEGQRLWERYKYELVFSGKSKERQLFKDSTGVRLIREEKEPDSTTVLVFSVTFRPLKQFR